VTVFVVFGFTCQFLLLAFFVAHLRRSALEGAFASVVYGLGLAAAVLAVASGAAGEPWWMVLAFALYAIWAAFGAVIDVIRPIPWRQPPRWTILVPYAVLLMAALLAFWVPLWWVDRALWVAFGVLYAAHLTLNIASHRAAGSPRGGPTPHGA